MIDNRTQLCILDTNEVTMISSFCSTTELRTEIKKMKELQMDLRQKNSKKDSNKWKVKKHLKYISKKCLKDTYMIPISCRHRMAFILSDF